MSRSHSACMALLLLTLLAGCGADTGTTRWRVTLDNKDKKPYGAWLAYESLQYYFPGAKVETLPPAFRYSHIDAPMKDTAKGRGLMILTGLDFYVTTDEWTQLKDFAKHGNEVVVFCSNLSNGIERELNCRKVLNAETIKLEYVTAAGIESQHAISLAADTATTYGYNGRSLRGYFIPADDDATSAGSEDDGDEYVPDEVSDTATAAGDIEDIIRAISLRPDTIGYTSDKPNFIRFSLGDGHITLHAAPLVLSNYFLLQPGNEAYVSAMWSAIPPGITRIYWNSYFKRSARGSDGSALLRHPATRLALILAAITLLAYILFEGKRKQRIIPELAPLRNDSVSFVETVGRLYYNKGNHANLASKMVQQFLEWVRLRYQLNTNQLNDAFARQLSVKSGLSRDIVNTLMDMIHEVKLGTAPTDDAYLYRLYNIIQEFYKTQTPDK